MTERVRYTELRPEGFRERLADAPIAYVPLGTLEWHGEHLPLGSDGIQSEGFFIELAREAGGIVLPMLYLGPCRMTRVDGSEYYGMDILSFEDEPRQLDGSAYWVSDELFGDVLEATLKQLARAGFEVVVMHGHGPSTEFVEEHADEWEDRFDVAVLTCWREDESDGLGIMTDHAAANETSLVMALRPELVEMDALPEEEWPLGIMGEDPREVARAERGQRAIELQRDRMADVLGAALEARDR